MSLNTLYRVVGTSKQSVYQARNRQEAFDVELSDLIVQVDAYRADHPGCGVEKMYSILKPERMGRDKFCEIMLSLGYRIHPVRNKFRTTYSSHIHYPNLIEGRQLMQAGEMIQSDITYFHLNGEYYYLVFIIDVYTREIIGFNCSDHMRTSANLKALKQALPSMTAEFKVHHSDRGSQYGSKKYRDLLEQNQIEISMGLIAQDNAYAERVNGIIKNEYLKLWEIKDFKDLCRKVKKAVNNYNTKRKHNAFKNKYTPSEFRESLLNLNSKKKSLRLLIAR